MVNEKVRQLLARLSVLNVDDWLSGLQEGHDALQTPTLEIEMDIDYAEEAAGFVAPKKKTVKLSFAPSGNAAKALFYIGSCTDVSDYFLITRQVYQELAASLLKQ